MVLLCSHPRCQTQLSRARVRRGYSTCARHGPHIRRGNPQIKRVRTERRCCQYPGCGSRLSAERSLLHCRFCSRHGGALPRRLSTTLNSRFSVPGRGEMENAIRYIGEVSRPGCLAGALLNVAFRLMLALHSSGGWLPSLRRPVFDAATVPPGASPELVFLNVIFALRAGTSALALVGWLDEWDPHSIGATLVASALAGELTELPTDVCNAQRNAFSRARRMCSRTLLLDSISAGILIPVSAAWEARSHILQVARQTQWMPLLKALSRLRGFGTFWPNIVAWHLRALGLATFTPADRLVSCLYGPGALRGLNLLLRRSKTSPLEQPAALRWGQVLVRLLAPLWPRAALGVRLPPLEAYIVEWLLCELSKLPEALWRT